MKQSTILHFSPERRDFVNTLNKRVHDYFKTRKLSRHANLEMKVKTAVMFSLYFIPYALIVGNVLSMGGMIAAVVVMSIGLSGIGLSVMHDANHGAYSDRKWVNQLLGYSLNIVGASAFSWKIQHNVLHHAYTNVHNHDEDISPRGILRLNPHTDWKPFHRYQFLYAWFLYGLMTVVWMLINDFIRMFRYQRNGLAARQKANMREEWLILIGTKVLYLTYIFVIPVLVTPLLWWQVIIGILIMHYITGFVLAIIFQPAHVAEEAEFPLPQEDNTLQNNWAIHQLLTTVNFGNRSRWFSWYVGGLNFQIEHHLFPHVCHVHYRDLSKIVRETALEYGVPYHSTTSFWKALQGHARQLRQFGQPPVKAEPVFVSS